MRATDGLRRSSLPISSRLRSQSGLTMVEVMVAAALLLSGLLATWLLVDIATAGQSKAKAREGATNLARELLEEAHTTPYAKLGGSGWFDSTLQSVQGGSGSLTQPSTSSRQTTVSRRGTSYQTTVSWCSLDDSKDGYGPHAAGTAYCSDSTATGTADSQPEDMKRVKVELSWSVEGRPQPALVQIATFGAGGAAIGPEASDLKLTAPPVADPYAPVITSNPGDGLAKFEATSVGAADMRFTIDGQEQGTGITNLGSGKWGLDWNILPVKDGTYTVGAIAVDALGTRGPPRTLRVKLARGAPMAPQNVIGGYNQNLYDGSPSAKKTVVELEWDANAEGSVTGYSVEKGGSMVAGCEQSLKTSCIDLSPASSGSTTYTVKTHYTDSSGNAQSVYTDYPVTAPSGASLATEYYLHTTKTVPTAKCYGGFGWRDLLASAPTGTAPTDGLGLMGDEMFCTQTLPAGASLGAGTATFEIFYTNTNRKSCTLPYYLYHNQTPTNAGNAIAGPGLYGTAPYLTIPAGTSSITKFTVTFDVPARTFVANDQLALHVYGSTSSGSCSDITFYFSSALYPAKLTVPTLSGGGGSTLQAPGVPTGLTVTPNADGTRTLTWTAPTGTPEAAFYRIYRDGQNYTSRVDTTDTTRTSVAVASSAGHGGLAVDNAAGFAPGQTITVDTGAKAETMTINAISGNVLALTAAMSQAHAVGAPVAARSVTWTDTNTGGSSHSYRVTAVSANLAESEQTAAATG